MHFLREAGEAQRFFHGRLVLGQRGLDGRSIALARSSRVWPRFSSRSSKVFQLLLDGLLPSTTFSGLGSSAMRNSARFSANTF